MYIKYSICFVFYHKFTQKYSLSYSAIRRVLYLIENDSIIIYKVVIPVRRSYRNSSTVQTEIGLQNDEAFYFVGFTFIARADHDHSVYGRYESVML